MKIAPTSITNQYGTKLNSSNYGKEKVSNVSLNNQSVPNFKANPKLTKKALGTIKGMLKEVPAELPSINTQDNNGKTQLIRAAESGQIWIVKTLCKDKNLDPNIQDEYGYTALIYAAESGYIKSFKEIVKELLNLKNINPNIKNEDGDTALISAAEGGYIEIVKELLKLENIDPNIQNKDGDTALILAVINGDTEIVKELLKLKNIDPSIQNKCGDTALSSAAEEDTEIVKLLKKYQK